MNGDVYQYEYNDTEHTADTYLNDNFYNRVTYDENDNAVKMEYANEDVIDYEYYQYNEDSLLKSVSLNGEKTFEYQYEENKIVKVEDFLNDTSYEMTYDEEDNLTGYKTADGLEKQISYSEEADTYTENCIYEGEERTVTLYTTETEEGIQLHAAMPNGTELVTDSRETKAARYLEEAGNSILLDEKNSDENSFVTSLINLLGTYEYEYDMNGNLQTVYKDGEKIYYYIYDKNQQLVQYYDYQAGVVSEYLYDSNYNILKTVTSDLSGNKTEEKVYEYGEDTTLGLQRYDGEDIIYDESGNPVEYYNGWKMSWNSGRMLEGITNGESVISYSYNKDGIRIGKTVNGIETEYLLDETNKIIGEKCGEDILWYLYDSGDEISGFEWNGTDYYYVKNAVGDVQGITDKDGNVKCIYNYDVWGKLTEMKGDKELGEKNSIRYRGYYYDEETRLYYLNTRYYDSEVKRFLNRDMLDNETNLYQYCYNNPVLSADVDGMGPTDCDDNDIVILTRPYGFAYDLKDKAGSKVARFLLNGQEQYFNCYMWAINKYNNIGIKRPGEYYGDEVSDGVTSYVVAIKVKHDLNYLGYRFKSLSVVYPNEKQNGRIMAVRVREAFGNFKWDYHFLKLQSYKDDLWSFKAGSEGFAANINRRVRPHQMSQWYSYVYDKDYGKWTRNSNKRSYYSESPTSPTYYIVYK